ncbi:hypothetical protein L6452_33568 [Arctium lappa]|uniref:Uncharacterized protein n=1 Tax=Arctium lappa TaxID=4217 RepID=A0ACB8YH05_ARCLA|nr:hypothetical protein L6452_33568 [Arctium lappa]
MLSCDSFHGGFSSSPTDQLASSKWKLDPGHAVMWNSLPSVASNLFLLTSRTKFGVLDVNDPASAEAFTVIFTRRKQVASRNHQQLQILVGSMLLPVSSSFNLFCKCSLELVIWFLLLAVDLCMITENVVGLINNDGT